MSKQLQIESALLAMDGGRFQQLCDAYLRKRGYQGINPLGRVVGTDKVAKGTPDTWIAQPNGKFIFAEYTTQKSTPKSKVAAKLQRDFRKCVDEAKTGVPVDRVQEIILCHTETLTPAEESALLDEAEARGVLLTTIGIGPLVHDLYEKYPGLAFDYLGVEVDTGQVLAADDFVAAYGLNALAAPLDTGFHARESDIATALEALETRSLLLVSGRPGVGKSRLALECFRRFVEAHPGWTVRCILNRGRDLFQDLRVHLSPPGKYLVLVDDANRVSGFDYVLQLVQESTAGREIKVAATVRDYALQKVQAAVRPYGGAVEMELHRLTDDEIKAIVREEYRILNEYYLRRIADVAKGNPRLAVMAARVAVRENTLSSIADVTSLYDEYYATVRQEVDAFGDRMSLRVAGIISFFRHVDRNHAEQMDLISAEFGIAPDTFWETAQRLHNMELVDMYEDEVVKISDQVLATYLFYLAFFKERNVLDVGVLLERFFPRYRHRFMDALSGVLSAFDNEAITARLRPHIHRTRQLAEAAGDEHKLLHLIDAFWFVSPTDTLVAIQERVERMPFESRGGELKLDYRSGRGSVPEASVLHALGQFRYGGEWRRTAIDLLLHYVAKQPSDLPHVLHYLIERYGFRHTSLGERYEVESTVVDALIERIERADDDLFDVVFLVVAEAFLDTRFDASESTDNKSITIYNFDLDVRPELTRMRAKLWKQLLALSNTPHRDRLLSVLHAYARSTRDVTVPEIVAEDSKYVLPFIDSELNPDVFTDCVLVQDYLNLLSARHVPYDESLRTRFQSETYVLSDLINPGWSVRWEVGYERYNEWQREQIREHFKAYYNLNQYQHFFEQSATLLACASGDHSTAQVRIGVESVLLELGERDPALFAEVVDSYLAIGNPLDLAWSGVPMALVTQCGSDCAFSILTAHEFQRKPHWLFYFYQALPPEHIDGTRLQELYALCERSEAVEFPYNLGFLRKYAAVDADVFPRVVQILVSKAERHPYTNHGFESIFNSYSELAELPDVFAEREELLERAYLVMQPQQQHGDYHGAVFNMLLGLDPEFGRKYVDWVFEHHTSSDPYPKAPDPHHDHRQYDFIWRRDNYVEIMEGITQRVYELEKDRIAYRSYVDVFFAVREPDSEQAQGSADDSVRERQDRFLEDLIERRAVDIDFVVWLWGTVRSFSPERKSRLLSAFLAHNRKYDDFRRLPLDHKMWQASGSFVPLYQKRVEVLESFLPLFRSSDLLHHRKHVEDEINEYRLRINGAKKEDFMRD